MQLFRFILVGFGAIGKRHAQEVMARTDAALVAIVDTNPEKQLLSHYPTHIPFYHLIDDALIAEQADVAIIATPNGLHAPLAISALNAGLHVLVEKPMALSVKACKEMIAAAEKAQRKLFVVKQNRYSPPVKWLKQVITDQRLGKILMLQINCFWNRDERYYLPPSWRGTQELDGGVLFTQFSHFIDILYWVFGDIEPLATKAANMTHQSLSPLDDNGVVLFQTAAGALGSLCFSTSVWDQNLESSLTVIGEKGSVKISGQYMNEVAYCHISDYQMPEIAVAMPANQYGAYQGSASNHAPVIANVIETLKGQAQATTNAHEGLKVVEIIEKIYQANT